jgi:cysteine desulfurase
VLDAARADVAVTLGAVSPTDIVFCPSATFANNLALRGALAALPAARRHVAVSAIEHSSVLETARDLGQKNLGRVTILPVDSRGIVRLDALESALAAGCSLVSVMGANNEVGTIEPVAAIAALCQRYGAIFHCDASQAFGRVPLANDQGRPWPDLVTISGHKVYGPQGIAALYVRPGLALQPITTGGTHERGLVPGTPAVAPAVGLGVACKILRDEGGAECVRAATLRDRLAARLFAGLGPAYIEQDVGPSPVPASGLVHVNGPWHVPPVWSAAEQARRWIERGRLPGNLHVTLLGVCPTRLFAALDPVLAVSGAAACKGPGSSHVLAAMDVNADHGAPVRFGVGRFTTAADVDRAADVVVRAAKALQGEGCPVEHGTEHAA